MTVATEYHLEFEDGPAQDERVVMFVEPSPTRWFIEYESANAAWWVSSREPTPDSGLRITRYDVVGPIGPGVVTYRKAEG